MTQVFFTITLLLLIFQTIYHSFFSLKIADFFQFKSTTASDHLDIRDLNEDDFRYIFEGDHNELFVMTDKSDQKLYFQGHPIKSIAFSPSKTQMAITYRPDKLTGEVLSLALLNLINGTSREIFHTEFPSWDITSDVQWLGEDYLFFLRHCGSSCQGLSLLNTHSGEVSNATLAYQSFPEESPSTHFNDWFGKEYH